MNLSRTPGPPDARADVSGFATPLVRHATEPYYHAIGDETGCSRRRRKAVCR
jgi:hypothetical protein